MPLPNICRVAASFVAIALAVCFSPLEAANGHPIAIVKSPDGTVRIENHWGLEITVSENPHDDEPNTTSQRHPIDFSLPKAHILSRHPNNKDATWIVGNKNHADPNQIRVAPISFEGAIEDGLLVETDGIRILLHSGTPIDGSNHRNLGEIKSIDALVLSDKLNLKRSGPSTVNWIKSLQPRFVLLPSETSDTDTQNLANQLGSAQPVRSVNHNTFAISTSSTNGDGIQLVRLTTQPYQLSDELQDLFAKMEASCRKSQNVFAELSASQLNFKPSNGTHTPRWNAEHMMGRQLLFFSQIYHAVDPAIPVMDLNPKQMPPDYVAAHPEWDGREEARQMQRVSDFTRRFAYLLDGVDLDRQAPGSRWTLRGLLRQMERHYDDHTANTQKKFELPDWPAN